MSSKVKTVQPSGILDGEAANRLRYEIREFIDKGAKTILVDLQQVTLMNSSAIGALVATLKSVRSAGGQLFLCSPSDQVRIILELTKMDRVFKVFASRDEFEQKVVSS